MENKKSKSVIDRFGVDVKTEVWDDEHFTATVEVSVSPTFYGWVFSFGGRIGILSPEHIASDYLSLTSRTMDSLNPH